MQHGVTQMANSFAKWFNYSAFLKYKEDNLPPSQQIQK